MSEVNSHELSHRYAGQAFGDLLCHNLLKVSCVELVNVPKVNASSYSGDVPVASSVLVGMLNVQ